jgi:aminoglycoside/choline kinase family phosphotransferase
MDADPATGQDTEIFTRIGGWLSQQNLSSPKSLLHDPTNGFLLLEDLGPDDFAMCLAKNPKQATTLYTAATDILIRLDSATPPPGLVSMTPTIGGEMVGITAQWYGDPDQTHIIDEMTAHLQRFCPVADKIALRDFHAENLIWRPTMTGTDRVGLLDYQDAFLAPRGYDLVSLLRDVRRVVDPTLATAMMAHFMTKIDADPDTTMAAFACLSVQRNLRILGVFARLALRDGKNRYIAMIPHIWSMICTDLRHPALADLRKCVEQTLPAPEKSAIKDYL